MNHPSIITPARINRRRVRHNPLTVAALAMGLVSARINRRRVRHNPLTVAALAMGLVSAVLIAAIAIHLS